MGQCVYVVRIHRTADSPEFNIENRWYRYASIRVFLFAHHRLTDVCISLSAAATEENNKKMFQNQGCAK